MVADSVFQTQGGLRLPIYDGEVTDSFAVLDDVQDRLLKLFAAAINYEFGNPWASVVAGLPSAKLNGTSPANDLIPEEPTLTVMTERKVGFPALFLHRNGDGTFEDHTLEHDKLRQQWYLHWVVGPLDLESRRKILPLGVQIGKLIKMVERQQGHLAYEGGANQFEEATGGLTSLRLVSITPPGPASFADDPQNITYYGARYTIETTEVGTDLIEQEADLDGFMISEDVGGANNPDLSYDFISATSPDPPFQYP